MILASIIVFISIVNFKLTSIVKTAKTDKGPI